MCVCARTCVRQREFVCIVSRRLCTETEKCLRSLQAYSVILIAVPLKLTHHRSSSSPFGILTMRTRTSNKNKTMFHCFGLIDLNCLRGEYVFGSSLIMEIEPLSLWCFYGRPSELSVCLTALVPHSWHLPTARLPYYFIAPSLSSSCLLTLFSPKHLCSVTHSYLTLWNRLWSFVSSVSCTGDRQLFIVAL